jgi:hypothetical protein
MPPELEPYLSTSDLSSTTVVGGMWDYGDWSGYGGGVAWLTVTRVVDPEHRFRGDIPSD